MKAPSFIVTVVLHFSLLPCLASATIKHLSVGGLHALALKDSGKVFIWGANSVAQLGTGDLMGASSPLPILISTPVEQIAARRDHSCLLFSGGEVRCWGSNAEGQLGLGRKALYVGGTSEETVDKLPSLKLGSERIERLILGNHHTCALTQSGTLKCFGSNHHGALGIGKTVTSIGQLDEQMGENLTLTLVGGEVRDGCAGKFFTCALLRNGSVKCWGSAVAAGNGTEKTLGTKPEEMGENLAPVALGHSGKVTQIACADQSVCALLESGELKCWGKNVMGVLGLGLAEGTVLGDSPAEMGEALPAVALEPPLRVKGVSCGYAHCCALLENHAMKCWGANGSGQLGLGDTKPRGLSLSEMGTHLPYVDLGAANLIEKVQVGSVSSCALLRSGEVKCWGGNHYGQLALPIAATAVGVFPEQMGENLKSIVFP